MVLGSTATVPVAGLRLWLIGAALAIGGIPRVWAIEEVPPSVVPGVTGTPSGLRMECEAPLIQFNGYRILEVRISPQKGVTKTARRLRLEAFNQYLEYAGGSVYHNVVVPAGSTGTTATIWLPPGESIDQIRVWERGREREDLTCAVPTGSGMNPLPRLGVLIIDADAPTRAARRNLAANTTTRQISSEPVLPDARCLAVAAGIMPYKAVSATFGDFDVAVTDAEILAHYGAWGEIELLPFAELPEEWVLYTPFDMIAISLDDLTALAVQDPGRFQTLREFVATGPLLCVHGVGADFARLRDLEVLLNLPTREPSASDGGRLDDWQSPSDRFFEEDSTSSVPQDTSEARYITDANGSQRWVSGQELQQHLDSLARSMKSSGDDAERVEGAFVTRRVGMGTVMAIGQANAFPGTLRQWRWRLRTFRDDPLPLSRTSQPTSRVCWVDRHGITLGYEGNNDYWNWLLPGVGQAPVGTFLAVISLFCAVIGPATYFTLRKLQSLPLLPLVVPILSGLVTLAVVFGALLAEGVQVRSRIRSATMLDSMTGSAVIWSRHSYYSPLMSSYAMKFPRNAAVYPIWTGLMPRPVNIRYECDADRQLMEGYLPARTVGQCLVIQTESTAAEVLFRAEGERPPAVNRLGMRVETLVLRGPDGTFYVARDLDPDASVRVERVEMKVVDKMLAEWYRAHQPATPEGIDISDFSGMAVVSAMRYQMAVGGRYSGNNPRETQWDIGLLERQLSTLKDPSTGLAPGQFVAIVPSNPLVANGVAVAREQESAHVVFGDWKAPP